MSLYLKYRPKDFDNLVGQKFIKETLKTAIQKDKLVGAYLFCGPRGTGKTSTARIFAKAINCLNQKNGNPCNECEICEGINNESLIDIIEIDAASHTGVDNIREIIERAAFSPSHAKYKVYIIDEVHMLSKGAFNALLKILEEPPSHVKFILATTETHKVPETIISRCQRYDFKRITNEDIIERLKHISNLEKINVDEDSYKYIASHSNGGLRDAISLYEQLISNNEINYNYITERLGLIGDKELNIFLNYLLNLNVEVIDEFNKLIENGKNIKLFFKELIFYITNISIEKIKRGEDISDYINILDNLNESYSKSKNSLDENTTFIIGIMKILAGNQRDIPVIKETKKIINKKQEETCESIIPEIIQNSPEKVEVKSEKLENSEEDREQIIDTVLDIDKLTQEISDKQNSNGGFSPSSFIAEMKSLGAKPSAILILKECLFLVKDDCFEIKVNTKFGKNKLETVENITLAKEAIKKIGLGDLNIKITV